MLLLKQLTLHQGCLSFKKKKIEFIADIFFLNCDLAAVNYSLIFSYYT